MTNFMRMLWVALVLCALLIPTMVVGMMSVAVAEAPARAESSASGEAAPLAAGIMRTPGAPEPQLKRSGEPILMAGGPLGAWLVVPRVAEKDHKAEPQFELWSHPRNASDNRQRVFRHTPRALTLVPKSVFDATRGEDRDWVAPYIVIGNSSDLYVRLYSLTSDEKDEELYYKVPDGENVVAAVGSHESVFVLTRGGVPAPAATASQTAPASGPLVSATTESAGSQPATQTIPDKLWNVWSFHDNRDPEKLSSLGAIDARDPAVPTLGAEPVLMHVPGRLIVAWREPAAPGKLIVRTLSYQLTRPTTVPAETASRSAGPRWSGPIVSDVGEVITRLMPLAMDGQLFATWPVKNAKNAAQLDIRGCALGSDFKAAPHPLFPIDLGPMSENVDPKKDLALAQCGTAVFVVTYGADGKLRSRPFPGNGEAAPTAQVLESRDSGRQQSMVAQHIMIVIMVSLLAISLWQWRLRPIRLSLPKTYRIARLRERALAAVIDLAIPTVVVLAAFSFYDLGDWADTFKNWDETFSFFFPFVLAAKVLGSIQQWSGWPEQVSAWPQLCFALGGYLAHVTIGEILTGRSVGKAIIKLRVVAMDGTKAPPLHIVVRNVVKIAEMGTGVLLIYIVISEHRQRLGDLLARTMVIDLVKRGDDDDAAKKPEQDNASADK